MTQLAVRLANEGVPVQAIARATGTPSTDVREQLASALLTGDLVHLPLNDWPQAQGAERRPALIVDTKPAQEKAAQRLFKLSPTQTKVLFLLLQQPEVSRVKILKLFSGKSRSLLSVTMHYLRMRLRGHGFAVHTMHDFGYCMSQAHQRKIKSMLRAAR